MFRRLLAAFLLILASQPLWSQSFDYATADPFAGGSSFTLYLSHIDRWHYPLPGAKVISPYGERGRHHTGVDLKTFARDTIRAAFDGIVVSAQPITGYGNCLIVRHPYGFETLYSHNAKNLVAQGDYVEAGQPIALAGRTGRATTEHLHFELRVADQRHDPQLLFDHDTHQLRGGQLVFFRNGRVNYIK